MKAILAPIAILAVAFACNAQAGLSQLNATCPGNIEVHVDDGGPVYINGKEAKLTPSNENYYEARDAASGVVVSISKNPDGSSEVSYTGKNRANGVCTVAKTGAPARAAAPARKPAPSKYGPSERNCLMAVAKQTKVAAAKLSVIGSEGSEAGIQVKVRVPGADAPWNCMTDQKGKPWNVSYSGSEGKL